MNEGEKMAVLKVKDDQGNIIQIPSIKGERGYAATVQIGTVTVGETAYDAYIDNSGTDTDAILDFVIPRGPAGNGTGDMLSELYDKDLNGIVDNAERLGGQLPEYYAKAEHEHIHGHTMDDVEGLNECLNHIDEQFVLIEQQNLDQNQQIKDIEQSIDTMTIINGTFDVEALLPADGWVVDENIPKALYSNYDDTTGTYTLTMGNNWTIDSNLIAFEIAELPIDAISISIVVDDKTYSVDDISTWNVGDIVVLELSDNVANVTDITYESSGYYKLHIDVADINSYYAPIVFLDVSKINIADVDAYGLEWFKVRMVDTYDGYIEVFATDIPSFELPFIMRRNVSEVDI